VKVTEPQVPIETWEQVQRILDDGKSKWKNRRRPARFLLSGLLECSCGKPYYNKAASRLRGRDYHLCASRHPSGKGCGAPYLRREEVESTVERIIGERLLDRVVLVRIFAEVEKRWARPNSQPEDLEQQVAKLESKRKRLVDLAVDGEITREEFTKRVRVIDQQIRDAHQLAVRAPISIDFRQLASRIAQVFARFHFLPFEDKRKLLQCAIGKIVVQDGAIPSLTLSGGFLEELMSAKTSQHSRLPCWRRYTMPGSRSLPVQKWDSSSKLEGHNGRPARFRSTSAAALLHGVGRLLPAASRIRSEGAPLPRPDPLCGPPVERDSLESPHDLDRYCVFPMRPAL
jgi:hypothetical protein